MSWIGRNLGNNAYIYIAHEFSNYLNNFVLSSVASEPKLGSVWLGLNSARAFDQKVWLRLACFGKILENQAFSKFHQNVKREIFDWKLIHLLNMDLKMEHV